MTRMPVEKNGFVFDACFNLDLLSLIKVNQSPADDSPPKELSDAVAPNADGVGVAPDAAAGTVNSLGSLPKIVKFDSLARCGDEIWIENEGQIYRLRKTRQGKLILTK